jgi:oligogalacturonide lyase
VALDHQLLGIPLSSGGSRRDGPERAHPLPKQMCDLRNPFAAGCVHPSTHYPNMHIRTLLKTSAVLFGAALSIVSLPAQVGRTFPSEKKTVIDPVTGTVLSFLTSTPAGDSKIYQTHPDWTSDGKWLIFRSNRARGQAFAVNEDTGTIVQVTDKGYLGMLCVARKSMKLYIMRDMGAPADVGRDPYIDAAAAAMAAGNKPTPAPETNGQSPTPRPSRTPGFFRPKGPFEVIEIDLGRLFADAVAGTVKGDSDYERVCGTTPDGMHATGNMGLDANEDFVYFGITGKELTPQLAAGTEIAKPFGPRNMGAGPSGLASMNLKTGEVKTIVVVPFQIGHVQTNPWNPGEIVFCWETGGKAPQRTWTIMADGTGMRPLYPEAPYEWITHEAVITKDEVAIAILYLRPPLAKMNDRMNGWGPVGNDEHPTGVGIVNLRTHEMRIVGQVPIGNPGRSIWHVNGSADGRWACADDFKYRLWIIDRHTGEMALLASMGQVTTAADHIHPTFNADGTKIEIQSAMLSENKRSLNICVVPVPAAWLARTYDDKNRLLAQ